MKELLTTALFRTVAVLPLAIVRLLGASAGLALWLAGGREARVTQANLDCCFADRTCRQRRRLARRSLIESGKTGLELIKVLGQPFERTLGCVHVRNRALFDAGLRGSRGLLVLVPHLGNWEVVGLWCATHGAMTSLYQPPKQAWLERPICAARQRTGATLVPTDFRGLRSLLMALYHGSIVGILPDQEPLPAAGVHAPFFGVPGLTMTLVGRLAARTGCAIVTARALRVPGGFELVFNKADAAIGDPDPVVAATALNRSVEACVGVAVEQYQWQYKRFKRRPAGAPPIYRDG